MPKLASPAELVQESADTHGKRTVAIAIDDSPYSENAFNWALANHIWPDDLVVLLNVQPRSLDAHEFLGPKDASTANNANKARSHALLKKFADCLAEKHLRYKALSVVGHGKESLVDQVHEIGAVTLVVGSRGANLLSRNVLGSFSDYCANHVSGCSVLIVKPTVEQLKSMGVPAHHFPNLLSQNEFVVMNKSLV
ncbi:hypothetical protein HDU98_010682 [Podochytrium sp. JEL0797]|nr:hypothetical protein HDU98_010682 [Podochytrium sp. JEL0797]